MEIIWSDFASNTLKDIYTYYKDVANKEVAIKIKDGILGAAGQLLDHPDSGQIELTLQQLGEGHRYLVKGNYKIVYREVVEGILITDVFDTRQDPRKINDKKRKPSI
jgi:toxin ParE1/3/4